MVICGMVTSLTLTNVLETITNLSLVSYKNIFNLIIGNRSHRPSQQPNINGQFSNESSYVFVMTCIKMRQKLIISSGEAGINCDRALVQKLFLRTLEIDILSQILLQEVNHLLRQDSVMSRKKMLI